MSASKDTEMCRRTVRTALVTRSSASLTPQVPDARVRAAMAAFYKSNEGYAHQQASHTAAYFHRLLGVMDAVLAQPHLSLLEIGAGSAVGDAGLSRQAPRCASRRDGAVAGVDPGRHARQPAVAARSRRECARPSVSGSLVRCRRCLRGAGTSSRRGAALGEMLRVVRRPGYIIIGLPNHASLWTPIEDRLRRRDRRAFGVEARPRRVAMVQAKRGALRGESDSHRARSFCIASRFCTRPPAAMRTPSTTQRRSTCCDSFATAVRRSSRAAPACD